MFKIIVWYNTNMDKVTQTYVDDAASRAATEAVAKMREFHLDDLKVFGERMDIGFESVNRRIDTLEVRLDVIDERLNTFETRFDRVENALDTLLREMREERQKVSELKKQISDLTVRVAFLEEKLAATR